MSRSGYSDDDGDDPLAMGRWRQAVKKSLQGKRGQAMLRELVSALDAMEDKRLFPGNFATAEGEFCTLGVLGAQRGTRMDDLGDEDGCDTELVGQRFGIASAMAAEIMWMNDECAVDEVKWIEVEICGPMRPNERGVVRYDNQHLRQACVSNTNAPAERWKAMREWVAAQLRSTTEGAAITKAEK